MISAIRISVAVVVLGMFLHVFGATGPAPVSAQLQSCTFGPARPATEGTIFDRQPRITISATCLGVISRIEGLVDGQALQLEQTGLGTREVRLAMRPATPLRFGVHIVNYTVEGSVFSWGFTVVENTGNLWLTRVPAGQPACPSRNEWQLLYWGGAELTTIDAAASLCSNVDFIWQYRGNRWLGYSPLSENASDFWIMIERGEAHFLRGRNQ